MPRRVANLETLVDIKSILGYSKGSPYRNNPYLDIFTPDGVIDMSNTDIPLLAVDETGMKKVLKPLSGKHKFRGKKVREYKMQRGGRAPIYTDNPNDPRLKAYQDSLSLYNNTITANYGEQLYENIQDFKNKIRKDIKDELYSSSWYEDGKQLGTSIPITDKIMPIDYVDWDRNKDQWSKYSPYTKLIYKKPVQPVVFQKQVPIRSSKRSNIPLEQTTDEFNAPVANPRAPMDFTPKKTDYSYTYKDPSGGDMMGQKTVYFPDWETWNEFVKDQPIIDAPTNAAKTYGRAVGHYMKQFGGVYRTQEDVDNANKAAREFSLRHRPDSRGINPLETRVASKAGDPMVKYVNKDGTPYVPTMTPKRFSVPHGIQLSDIQSYGNEYWYNDPQSGDIVYVDPSVINLPRFRKSDAVVEGDIMRRNTSVVTRQRGGFNYQEAFDFLFEDENDEIKNTAPSTNDLPQEEEQPQQVADPIDYSQYDLSLSIAMEDTPAFNSWYRTKKEMQRTGKAGQLGQQIIADISSELGYTPQFNSVWRSPEKQEQLIKQGHGVKNSYHLTGDAVDMKPSDWKNLSEGAKKNLKSKYDVIYHNNHYHLEPKG